MIEKLRLLRLHISFSAVLIILMGVAFLIWPARIITTFTRMIGIILILIGLSQCIGKLFSRINKSSGMLIGALTAVVGFWIYLNPIRTASIIPIIIGVLLISHGIQNISLAMTGKGYQMPHWPLMLFGGILNMIFGIISIIFAFSTVAFIVQLLGIMMIYDGVSSILMVSRINRHEKEYIDVEYREI